VLHLEQVKKTRDTRMTTIGPALPAAPASTNRGTFFNGSAVVLSRLTLDAGTQQCFDAGRGGSWVTYRGFGPRTPWQLNAGRWLALGITKGPVEDDIVLYSSLHLNDLLQGNATLLTGIRVNNNIIQGFRIRNAAVSERRQGFSFAIVGLADTVLRKNLTVAAVHSPGGTFFSPEYALGVPLTTRVVVSDQGRVSLVIDFGANGRGQWITRDESNRWEMRLNTAAVRSWLQTYIGEALITLDPVNFQCFGEWPDNSLIQPIAQINHNHVGRNISASIHSSGTYIVCISVTTPGSPLVLLFAGRPQQGFYFWFSIDNASLGTLTADGQSVIVNLNNQLRMYPLPQL
jgi:hypothetical protein